MACWINTVSTVGSLPDWALGSHKGHVAVKHCMGRDTFWTYRWNNGSKGLVSAPEPAAPQYLVGWKRVQARTSRALNQRAKREKERKMCSRNDNWSEHPLDSITYLTAMWTRSNFVRWYLSVLLRLPVPSKMLRWDIQMFASVLQHASTTFTARRSKEVSKQWMDPSTHVKGLQHREAREAGHVREEETHLPRWCHQTNLHSNMYH